MNKRKQQRIEALMPSGIPRYVRCYDNGGIDAKNGSSDRYTVVYTGRYNCRVNGYQYVGMSSYPFHPQGIGIHASHLNGPIDTLGKDGRPFERRPPAIGRGCHLGKRIHFNDLPDDCKRLVFQDYCQLWDVPMPEC